MQIRCLAASLILLLGGAGLDAAGQEPAPREAAIENAIQSYVTAFNSGDVESLVDHWSPTGVYISRTSGEQIVGRAAMVEEFSAILADEQKPTLAVTTESIEFISPSVALERGTATVARGEEDVVETEYRVIYVLSDGRWLIDRVTEDEVVIETSHYDQLKELEWLIGEWSHAGDDDFAIDISCQWTKNQNFITRKYAVSSAEGVESSGLQIIGWDPLRKEIRSWLFDSDGGFVLGTWSKRDDGWAVQSVATLADGVSGSFTGVYRTVDDDTFAWKKINRVLDAELLPHVDEIVLQRK